MFTKHQVTENEIAQFNAFRVHYQGKEMTRAEMIDAISSKTFLKVKRDGYLFNALCQGVNPPIVKIERGKYMVAKEPVHIKRMQTAIDNRGPKKQMKSSETNDEKMIADAIAVLKNAGYKIYKPITKFEEV